jgi:predicted nucleic acid-binding Zn ribbon protein
MSDIQYTPGTCNIGDVEIKQRRRIGRIGLILTLVSIIIYLGLVYSIELDILFGVLIFLPAVMSAVGLLQARNKFCAAYGLTKQQNVSTSLGLTLKIEDLSNQKKDRNKAIKIVMQSILIAVTISLVSILGGIVVQGF